MSSHGLFEDTVCYALLKCQTLCESRRCRFSVLELQDGKLEEIERVAISLITQLVIEDESDLPEAMAP